VVVSFDNNGDPEGGGDGDTDGIAVVDADVQEEPEGAAPFAVAEEPMDDEGV